MDPVCITVYPTFVAIRCSRNGDVANGKGDIRRVLDKCREMEFDKNSRKFVLLNRYYIYDRVNGEMRVPRQLLSSIEDSLTFQKIPYEVFEGEVAPPRKICIKLRKGWEVREYQVPVVDHLANENLPMRGSDLQTGKGKTFSANAAIVKMGVASMIVSDGLLDQWKNAVLEQLDIKEDDVYVLKGANSVIRLMASELMPKIFIASLDTLKAFAQGLGSYEGMPTWEDFQKHYGIGAKFFDEFHLCFHTLVTIDLLSIIQHNGYLSATPKRSKRSERAIFDLIYPDSMLVSGGEYHKYVNVTGYQYFLDIPKESMFNTFHGYSHPRYEGYIQNNPKVRQRFLRNVLIPIINIHYMRVKEPGEKLLIFGFTRAFGEMIKRYLECEFPDLKVNTFFGDDPEENKEISDIIIGNPKACGTGTDIAMLRTVIRTDSDGSEPGAEQRLGRLRVLKSGNIPEFVDIYNGNLSRQIAHYQSRARVYKHRALKYTSETLHA